MNTIPQSPEELLENVQSMRLLSDCYFQQGRYEDAVDCLQSVLALDNDITQIPALAASIYERLAMNYLSLNDTLSAGYYRDLYIEALEATAPAQAHGNALLYCLVAVVVLLVMVVAVAVWRHRARTRARNNIINNVGEEGSSAETSSETGVEPKAMLNAAIDEYDERYLRHLALGYTKSQIASLKGMPFGVKSLEKRQLELVQKLFPGNKVSVNATRLVVRALELNIIDINNLQPDNE